MDREERQRERGMEKEKSQRREKTIKKSDSSDTCACHLSTNQINQLVSQLYVLSSSLEVFILLA